jgi:hypothetical protein
MLALEESYGRAACSRRDVYKCVRWTVSCCWGDMMVDLLGYYLLIGNVIVLLCCGCKVELEATKPRIVNLLMGHTAAAIDPALLFQNAYECTMVKTFQT